jgi:peptidoglycan/xylan/chitin deacetylase (PgdA/CDA1 family)
MSSSRRVLLQHAGTLALGAALGGSAIEVADAPSGPPGTPASSFAPAEVRGQVGVWWSAPVSPGPSGAVDRRLALTFDDGPTEQFTGQVLDLLGRRGVPATFFMIGVLARLHPDLVGRVRDAGHEIGNHGDDHISAARLGGSGVLTSAQRGADTLEGLVGRRPRWYRPPRGEVTSATLLAARATGQDLALWSVARAGGDLLDGDSAGVSRHLLDAIHPGAVVDLHDGIGRSAFVGTPSARLLTRRRAELAALPQVLDGWQAAGYQLVPLSTLIPPAAG